VTTEDAIQITYRARIIDLAKRQRIPVASEFGEFAHAGALMSFGPSILDQFRFAANYVDKIFKGAKPAELPVLQPIRFELISQSEHRQDPRSHHPAIDRATRRRGDRIANEVGLRDIGNWHVSEVPNLLGKVCLSEAFGRTCERVRLPPVTPIGRPRCQNLARAWLNCVSLT
jgi:hypothetical protein